MPSTDKQKGADQISKSKCKSQDKKSISNKVQKKKKSQESKSKKGKSSIDSKKAKSKSKPSKQSRKSKDSNQLKESKTKGKESKSSEVSGSIASKVRQIEHTKGPTALVDQSSLESTGYVVLAAKLYQGEYSQVLRARNDSLTSNNEESKEDEESEPVKLIVKVLNLVDCSPRFRINLLQNSVRIMRFISSQSKTLCPIFPKVFDIYLIGGARLFVFMAAFEPKRGLYDLVKSNQKQSPVEIRQWMLALFSGIDYLQRIGVAHRAVYLQHLVVNSDGSELKLLGWSRSVLYYQSSNKRIALQHKERRIRRNQHLPPEAFDRSYDPSKADLWSAAVVLVALSTKHYPFTVRDGHTKFSTQWREFTKKHELNTYVRNLCHKVFVIDPNTRITSKAVLKDKYFQVEDDRLERTNCVATTDWRSVKEDSRVGGLSGVDVTLTTSQPRHTKPEAEDEGEDYIIADAEPDEPNSTYEDGGQVGLEDNEVVPEESQMVEKMAAEETEEQAQVEDGERSQVAETEDDQ